MRRENVFPSAKPRFSIGKFIDLFFHRSLEKFIQVDQSIALIDQRRCLQHALMSVSNAVCVILGLESLSVSWMARKRRRRREGERERETVTAARKIKIPSVHIYYVYMFTMWTLRRTRKCG